jgi:hypothetical protein
MDWYWRSALLGQISHQPQTTSLAFWQRIGSFRSRMNGEYPVNTMFAKGKASLSITDRKERLRTRSLGPMGSGYPSWREWTRRTQTMDDLANNVTLTLPPYCTLQISRQPQSSEFCSDRIHWHTVLHPHLTPLNNSAR